MSAETSSNHRLLGLFFLATLFQVVVLFMGVIREEPSFWHDAGGYPVWVRQLVLVCFYPLLALGLIWLSWISLGGVRSGILEKNRQWTAVWLAGLWILQGVVFLVIVSNNIDNLRHHRPVHWHPTPFHSTR